VGIPRAPTGSRSAGRQLWRAVLAEFELDEHELALLRQAVAVADICEDLQALVDRDGPLVASRLGEPRAHPALVELRQQRIVLTGLIVALRVPVGEPGDAGRLQYRGTRGVYGLRGAS
jgi:hypothetical protein